MQSLDRAGNKPNDKSKIASPDIPAGAQTAYCPDCNRELHGQGHYDMTGSPTTLWWCGSHGYVTDPVFDGGDAGE